MMFRLSPIFLLLLFAGELYGLETVRIRTEDGVEKERIGRILLKGPQGEFLLQTRDGQLFQIKPDEIVAQTSDKTPFVPFTKEEVKSQLLEEFGPDFKLLTTEHYVIVYNTSEKYAKWIGDIFDRFYDKYRSVWKKFGLDLAEPDFPLVAVLFSDKKQFDQYGQKEIGSAISLEMSAYYHKWTNRIVLCDLSGIEKILDEQQSQTESKKRTPSTTTMALLNRPGAGYNVSATIHEAAHQIGCNDGMFSRTAPIPLWLLEGVAMLHEIADVNNPKRTESGEPKVNKKRLGEMAAFYSKNPNDPVRIMLQTDDTLRSVRTAKDYYGLSWGFTYFLYKKKPKQFASYLQMISAKTAADVDSPTLRLLDFEDHFGSDWEKLQKEFLRFARTLK